MLVFPEIHLDDATQVAFSKRLGKVELFNQGEFPEIFIVTLDPERNRSAAYLKGTVEWHIDGCTDDIPIMATMLTAHAVAETGGETEFASAYEAYETLSDEDKARVAGLRVVHTFEAAQRVANPDPSPEEVDMWRARPSKEHPLVWQHRSGRRSLVLGATTDHVVGMDPAEGRALLDDLLAHADLARACVPPRVEGRRHGHLGQPRRPPPGLPLRRRLAPRHAPHDLRR